MNEPASRRTDSWRSHALEALKRFDATLAPALARAARHSARRALPSGTPADVVVVRLWGLGNLALMTPLFAASRRSGQRMRLVTLERNRAFMRDHWPHVDVLGLPTPYRPAVGPAFARTLAALRRSPPDVVLDAESFLSLPTACVRAATPAPIVGVATPGQHRAALLDAPIVHDPHRHAADTFALIASTAGLALQSNELLTATDRALASVDALVPPTARPLVVLHPGSGDHFPGRRWPAARFARLARELRTLGCRVVVTGDRHERGLAAQVCLGSLGQQDEVLDLAAALDTAQLVALLARADLLVTNDTGPLHLADALGTPSVALFGPNTPERYGPRVVGSVALFAGLPCSPCLDERTAKASSCSTFECMQALSVERVLTSVRSVLARRRSRVPTETAIACRG